MTSAQIMLASALAALCVGLLSSGCARGPEYVEPQVLVSPYDASEGEALWAVVPPRNLSGTSVVDAAAVGDAVVAAAQGSRGLRCKPINATIEAMRALEMPAVLTPEDAERLASAMGVDGVVVGSVTAWDPYDPPTIGLALALFARPGKLAAPDDPGFDPRLFAMQATDQALRRGSAFGVQPVAVVSEHLDARADDVLLRLRRFATGRTDERSPFGWRAYTASMDLYTRFAAHEAVGGLLGSEWLRLARAEQQARR